MDSEFLLTFNLPLLIPSFLTVIACSWLFFKYCQGGWKRVGFSMIFILALSDFIYSLTVLSTIFFPLVNVSPYYRFNFFFCSNFSIYWAAAIAFLIYKTLFNKDLTNIKKLFTQTLLVVIAVTLVVVFM